MGSTKPARFCRRICRSTKHCHEALGLCVPRGRRIVFFSSPLELHHLLTASQLRCASSLQSHGSPSGFLDLSNKPWIGHFSYECSENFWFEGASGFREIGLGLMFRISPFGSAISCSEAPELLRFVKRVGRDLTECLDDAGGGVWRFLKPPVAGAETCRWGFP